MGKRPLLIIELTKRNSNIQTEWNQAPPQNKTTNEHVPMDVESDEDNVRESDEDSDEEGAKVTTALEPTTQRQKTLAKASTRFSELACIN